MTGAAAVDWGATQTAHGNRRRKAHALASWCWDRGVPGATVAAWDVVTRRRAARAADVHPPSDDSPTWGMVAEGLDRWAAEHPDAPRTHLDDHGAWCRGCDRPDCSQEPPGMGVGDDLPATCQPLPDWQVPGGGDSKDPARDLESAPGNAGELAPSEGAPGGSLTPTPGDEGATQPRGWADLVALGPVVPARPCGVPGPGGGPCGVPAVVRCPQRHGADVWRCGAHPPVGEEWGARLVWVPRLGCRGGGWCLCGRCDGR